MASYFPNNKDNILEIIEGLRRILRASYFPNNKDNILEIIEGLRRILRASYFPNNKDNILEIIEGLRRILRASYFPNNKDNILDGLIRFSSTGQLKSKAWLIKILKEKNKLNLGTVFVCAGWYGLLPYFLLNDEDFSIKQTFNFDIDPLSVSISEDFNRKSVKNNWKFKATLKNILELNYQTADFNTLKSNGEAQKLVVSPNTIINTACEHIQDFKKWWELLPNKKLIILQSNNFFESEDHVNCSINLKEFKKQAPLELIYEGELKLEKYKRFMLIGYKK